jgi:hypothetical protein
MLSWGARHDFGRIVILQNRHFTAETQRPQRLRRVLESGLCAASVSSAPP